MGNPYAAIMINNLNQMRKEFQYNESDRAMFFFHAIRYLCDSEKDRSSDLLKNIVIKSFAMGYVPEIPDIAVEVPLFSILGKYRRTNHGKFYCHNEA